MTFKIWRLLLKTKIKGQNLFSVCTHVSTCRNCFPLTSTYLKGYCWIIEQLNRSKRSNWSIKVIFLAPHHVLKTWIVKWETKSCNLAETNWGKFSSSHKLQSNEWAARRDCLNQKCAESNILTWNMKLNKNVIGYDNYEKTKWKKQKFAEKK